MRPPALQQPFADAAVRRYTWQRRLWTAVAALIILGGLIISALAAGDQSHRTVNQAHQQFRSVSAEVASSLQLGIEHEQDLVIGTAAFLANDPHASNAEFTRWARAQHAIERYPELLGLGDAVIVPASRVPMFAAAARRDPAGSLSRAGSFTVSPPGRRPFYCFTQTYVTRSPTDTYPAGFDWCDGPLREPLLNARDSGVTAYVPIKIDTTTALTVFTPAYRATGGASTIASRRSAFLGWVGLTVVPAFLLGSALAGHPQVAVTFSYHSISSNVAFHYGTVAAHAMSVAVSLHNGWTVRTFTAPEASGVFAQGRSEALLAGGVAVSLLLGALVFVLGTGRARAQRLVSIRTAELRHQVLHDGLTGLPNRTLIADRVERILARGRRSGSPGAVLFVDLDDFKDINDTLGHDAGDHLLQSVAARLTGSLREVDTVGRIGGDEFVVVIDGESDTAPELVAERLVRVIREPFELDGSAAPVTITTSVGVAVADRDGTSEVMRAADIALYQAKAAGKDRFDVFRPAPKAGEETDPSSKELR